MFKTLLGGLLGGIIVFAWSGFSWMVLPWHMETINHFKSEAAMVRAIKTNAPASGIYMMPMQEEAKAAQSHTPYMFASIHQEGLKPMKDALWTEFATQFIAAFLVTAMLKKTSGLSYLKRVKFVMMFALTAGIVTEVMYWNWFSFPLHYTMVAMADLFIAWTLAGLVIAKIVGNQRRI